MARPFRLLIPAIHLGLALLCMPLRSQLDPKLQTGRTDFLNLYQQSTSVKVKPEVLTIFDFSGSMEALMFHPLFVNTDVSDTGGQSMSFSLNTTTKVVTASLSIRVGNKSSLTSTILVKPDGNQVTATDAAAASTTSGQYGASAGVRDVRNWVRAASHVRFSATVTVGGVNTLRTIDIPIPWKIIDPTSTSNPLASQTVFDRQTKTATDGTVTNYGSGTNVEMDKCYTFSGGSSVLSGSSTTRTSTTLNTVTYRADYIVWLFSGKYAVGTNAGKFIIFDAENATVAGGQGNVSWGRGFGTAASGSTIMVPNYNLDGSYAGTETKASASVNIVPALNRVQAVKRAAISTWISHQADVIWAFRFLDVDSEANSGSATSINNNSKSTFNVAAGTVTSVQSGTDSAWTVLNNTAAQGITSTSGNSVTGMGRIASLFANNSTPLTYAMARGLAQFTDPNSVFNAVETGNDKPTQCMNHFIILFTDGNDNNGTGDLNDNYTNPYFITATTPTKIDAILGNQTLIGSKTSLNRSGNYWNMATFAGAAAHLGDISLGAPGINYLPAIDPGTTATSGLPSSFLPLSIYKRSTVIFERPHLVTTMTVGVSLGGRLDQGGPKYNLYAAAAVGDPTVSAWPDVSTLKPFAWDPTANSGNGGRESGSLYYFDATDPDKLSTSLNHAIISAIGASNINTSTNPTTPYIGSALGGEMFIAKFQPPANGGSIWAGDLMMFGTKLVGDTLQILNKSGTVTTTLDTTTAQWTASSAMAARNWWDRKLFTRLPGSSANPEPGLTTFSDLGTAFTALQGTLCQAANNPGRTSYTVGSTAQKLVAQWAMGGEITDLDASKRAKTNRTNIMGDIINSSPGVLEYRYSDVSGTLPARLSGKGNHFRLLLVGTNQGWLHAFGEVTKQDHATSDTSSPIVAQGDVDELWAFMPTDFLGYLDQLTVTTNPHRFLVDGAPAVYHLDLPSTSGAAANGVVDVTSDPGPERAMVIFGLGKGGRSYYALDIHDPYNPVLKWSIVPDEAALKTSAGTSVLQSRILARPGAPTIETVQKVIANMGFSTCTPGIGRVTVTDGTGAAVVRDAVFLGGGFSTPEVEVNFLDGSNKPTPMGRSVLALDAYSGLILGAVDLSDATTTIGGVTLRPGPIYRGLVPFEFILNSGMAQRAYFLDYWGGLWAWGSQKTDTASTNPVSGDPNPTYQYRIDSSDLTYWTSDGSPTSLPGVRLVAKDMFGSLITQYGYSQTQQYYSEALYTTLPAPFRVGSFPGKPKASTAPVPAAVGIAIESGDRNNPLDFYYTTTATPSPSNPATKPAHHRLTMIFDRQDSLAWGTMANPVRIAPEGATSGVKDVFPSKKSLPPTDASITPYSSSYFLAPSTAIDTKFGYYLNFPDVTDLGLIPKGINAPAVVSGSLYYSFFYPLDADPCKGGNGDTHTKKICDLLNPIVDDTRTNLACTSGYIWIPRGVASDFIALGTRGVIQIGTTSTTGAGGITTTALATKTATGQSSSKYPKARVWRTVH